MKMVPVYNATGDQILACACDLEHYQGIGWATEEPAKAVKPAKVKAEAIVEPTKEAE